MQGKTYNTTAFIGKTMIVALYCVLLTVNVCEAEILRPDAGIVIPWGQWGLAGGVIAFVLWRDWDRERRMAERSMQQEDWARSRLLDTLETVAAAISRLCDRPCLATDIHKDKS